MKRVISRLLIAVMCCGLLAGCGKKKVETNDFDSITNKSYSMKGYSFEVPDKWEAGEENTDDTQFYYPEDGMLQVSYTEMDGSILDESTRKEFFSGIEESTEKYKMLSESEIEVDGEKAYRQEMNIHFGQNDYSSTIVVFDCDGGIVSFWMYTLQKSEKDYSKDFEKILKTISKPLAFERTIDDVDNILNALELGGKCDFTSTDVSEESGSLLKNWIDIEKGTIITVVADENEKVTVISADAKDEEGFASVVIMALMGVDVYSKDASELLAKINPEDLKKMGTNPEDAIIEVIEGVTYLVQKTDMGSYKYMFSMQRDKETKEDYEAYVQLREILK